jgi:hypothetical protein
LQSLALEEEDLPTDIPDDTLPPLERFEKLTSHFEEISKLAPESDEADDKVVRGRIKRAVPADVCAGVCLLF